MPGARSSCRGSSICTITTAAGEKVWSASSRCNSSSASRPPAASARTAPRTSRSSPMPGPAGSPRRACTPRAPGSRTRGACRPARSSSGRPPPDEARRMVRDLAAADVDLIKMWVDGTLDGRLEWTFDWNGGKAPIPSVASHVFWRFSASHGVCGKARPRREWWGPLPRGATRPQAPWGAPFGRSPCAPLLCCGPCQYSRYSLRTTPCIDAHGEL